MSDLLENETFEESVNHALEDIREYMFNMSHTYNQESALKIMDDIRVTALDILERWDYE